VESKVSDLYRDLNPRPSDRHTQLLICGKNKHEPCGCRMMHRAVRDARRQKVSGLWKKRRRRRRRSREEEEEEDGDEEQAK